ncbi:MAG TPA: threonine/serine exporter [Tissierellia bacterium]|nr:threonine/serine exporter [Tissierellia bacterium]
MMMTWFYGFISTVGLSILFNIRRKHIVLAAIGGGSAGLIQQQLLLSTDNILLAAFVAAFVISIYSEIMAGIQKAPSTTYVIPGVLPLVPGAGMYYTMLYLAERNLSQAAAYGYQTVFAALAIACGVIIAPSIRRLVRQLRSY